MCKMIRKIDCQLLSNSAAFRVLTPNLHEALCLVPHWGLCPDQTSVIPHVGHRQLGPLLSASHYL